MSYSTTTPGSWKDQRCRHTVYPNTAAKTIATVDPLGRTEVSLGTKGHFGCLVSEQKQSIDI